MQGLNLAKEVSTARISPKQAMYAEEDRIHSSEEDISSEASSYDLVKEKQAAEDMKSKELSDFQKQLQIELEERKSEVKDKMDKDLEKFKADLSKEKDDQLAKLEQEFNRELSEMEEKFKQSLALKKRDLLNSSANIVQNKTKNCMKNSSTQCNLSSPAAKSTKPKEELGSSFKKQISDLESEIRNLRDHLTEQKNSREASIHHQVWSLTQFYQV